MGLLGDFAKGFVIMTVVFWIFLIIESVYMKKIAFAVLLLVGLIIPLSMIGFEYLRNRKKRDPRQQLKILRGLIESKHSRKTNSTNDLDGEDCLRAQKEGKIKSAKNRT